MVARVIPLLLLTAAIAVAGFVPVAAAAGGSLDQFVGSGWGSLGRLSPERLQVGDTYGIRKAFEPDRLLLTGGVGFRAGQDVMLTPEFGIGHSTQEFELGKGYENVLHRVHARAGGTLHLSDSFYLSAATKIPIFNYEFTDQRTSGGAPIFTGSSRHDYELFRLPSSPLSWSGEMGVKLGRRLDLNLFYDQNLLKRQFLSGGTQQEEVIGTRFIFRFK